MWWAGSSRVEVYLGSTVLGVRQPGASTDWKPVDSAQSALLEIRRALRAKEAVRRKVRTWLSAALARPFMVPADSGAQRGDEALAVAQSMAGDATGLTGELSVWIDVWRRDRPCVAVAIHKESVVGLRSVCATANAKLISVKPWWNLALDAAARSSSDGSKDVAWSLGEPDGMIQGTLRDRELVSIEYVGPIARDPGWIHARQRASVASGGSRSIWHVDATMATESADGLPIGGWTLLVDEPNSAQTTSAAAATS